MSGPGKGPQGARVGQRVTLIQATAFELLAFGARPDDVEQFCGGLFIGVDRQKVRASAPDKEVET